MSENSFTKVPVAVTLPISANRTHEFLRGAIYSFSPLNMTLSITILFQNILIIACYYTGRARFVPATFIAIATSNIIMVQGDLALSIVGNLVCGSEELNLKYLLYSLYMYQGTCAVGETCSKFYNVVLSVVLTLKIARPYTAINIKRVKLVMVIVTVVCAVLHLSDGAAVYYLNETSRFQVYEAHINTVSTLPIPGLWTLVSISCLVNNNSTLCLNPDGSNSVLTSLLFTLHVGAPPFILFVSMGFMVFKLSRSPVNETIWRHISITVSLVSTLFFFCHASFLGVAAFSYFQFDVSDFVKRTDFKYSYLTRGKVTGFAVFTLPLINAALFPLILITRDRQDFFRGIFSRVRDSYRNLLNNEDSESYPYT